jgi:hypothetical protein
MPGLRVEIAVHTEHGTTSSTQGARSRIGGDAASAEKSTRDDASPKTDG